VDRNIPDFTIAIPYYSNLNYLREAIDSVFGQNTQEWRLLICDDSQDGEARSLINEYRSDKIEYHRNRTNLGLPGNWNMCIELCRTKYLTILHSDDKLDQGYITLVKKAIENDKKDGSQSAIIFCRAEIIGSNGERVFSFVDYYKKFLNPCENRETVVFGEQGMHSLLKGNYIFCPSICYRTSIFEDFKFDCKWRMVTDLDFLFKLILGGYRFRGVPNVGYLYRRHRSNQTSILSRNFVRFEEEIELYNQVLPHLKDRGWSSSIAEAKRKNIIKMHLAFLLFKNLYKCDYIIDFLKFLKKTEW